MYIICLYVYLCTSCMSGACRSLSRASNPLEWTTVGSQYVGSETWTGSSGRAAVFLTSDWAISAALMWLSVVYLLLIRGMISLCSSGWLGTGLELNKDLGLKLYFNICGFNLTLKYTIVCGIEYSHNVLWQLSLFSSRTFVTKWEFCPCPAPGNRESAVSGFPCSSCFM